MTDGDEATTSQDDGHPAPTDDVEAQRLQNGAASTDGGGDVGQLISLVDDDGYHVDVRQQTEQTSHTAELVDGTEQVRVSSTSPRLVVVLRQSVTL